MKYSSLIFMLFFGGLLPAAPLWAETGTATTDSVAVQVYKQFANAFITGKFDKARAVSAADAAAVVDRKEDLVKKGEKIVPVMEPMFMIVSEEASDGGDRVDIHAVQVVQPATGEGMFQPPSLHRQYVTMTRQGSRWRVISFKDDQEKCCL